MVFIKQSICSFSKIPGIIKESLLGSVHIENVFLEVLLMKYTSVWQDEIMLQHH